MLARLELENFRNWPKFSSDFGERMVLRGPNGSGKTNILEAIYLLSVTRSWRIKNDRDLVLWGKDVCRVIGISQGGSPKIEIAIARDPYQKKIKTDDLESKATEAIGKITTVVFEPRLVNLVSGPPVGRRRFLDILLAQINQEYTKALVDFQIVLRNRNNLLRKIAEEKSQTSEIKFWNDELIRLGEILWTARHDFFIISQNIFQKSYQSLSFTNDAQIVYQPAMAKGQSYQEVLEEHWLSDLDQGATTIGPHRDDFSFILNNRPAAEIASQGEARSLVLALKKTEIEYLSKNMGRDPILLLDDIFSELDADRRSRIESLIDHHQTIITTTDLGHLEPHLLESFTVLDLDSSKNRSKINLAAKE